MEVEVVPVEEQRLEDGTLVINLDEKLRDYSHALEQARKIRKAKSLTKAEVKKVQSQFIEMIEKSDLENVKPFLRTMKNIQTEQQLKKAMPELVERLQAKVEQQKKRTLREQIKKELKVTKVKKQGGKPVGKYTAQVQKVLDMAREATTLTKAQAAAKIAANIEMSGEKMTGAVALENRILGLFAGYQEATSQEMQKILNEIKGIKGEGKFMSELKKLIDKIDVGEKVNKIIEVIAPEARTETGEQTLEKGPLLKRIKSTLVQFGRGISGWNNLMDMLSYKHKASKTGESPINKIMKVSDMETAEKKGVRIATDQITHDAVEAFGFKNEKELTKKFREDAQVQNLGKFTLQDGTEVTLKMSKSEARKRWMEFQDPTLEESFFSEEGMGWTEEMRQAIDSFLTEQDKDFAMRQLAFYQEFYDRVNEVYRELYGVDLPKNEFYSPIRRAGYVGKDNFTDFLGEINMRNSTAPTGLKTRVENLLEIVQQGDIDVLSKHINEMEHFIAWGEKVRELNAILQNPQIRTAIKAEFGMQMSRTIDKFLRDFTRGGIDRSQTHTLVEKMRINFTQSVLAIKPSIAVKQLVSFVAYMDYISPTQFASGVADFFRPEKLGGTGPLNAAKILAESEVMKARGANITRDIHGAMKTDAYTQYSKNPSLKML